MTDTPLSDARRKDPSMLGGTDYERSARDFYPTPPRATQAFISVVEDDLEGMQFWEPFAGNGAIYNLIAPLCRNAGATDIFAYDGFQANGLMDFFNIYVEGSEELEKAIAAYEASEDDRQAHFDTTGEWLEPKPYPQTMADVESLFGFRPDCIISNPPYGKDTDRAVRKALELMEPEVGYVAFLMRHEWDTAKGRAALIDHPAFIAKITLRFRPVWIEKKEGEKSASPRFSYAWYVWDWAKAVKAPHAKAELYYAG